jgi:hypothetical protein
MEMHRRGTRRPARHRVGHDLLEADRHLRVVVPGVTAVEGALDHRGVVPASGRRFSNQWCA